MRTKLQHVHFEGFNFWHFLIFILLHQNCGFKRTIAKSIYRLILNILWLFYSIKYGIDIGYTFMIIIEIDNIMGGNNILWTVECEREETCFDYYSWEFLKGKKEDFLLTAQIYECEYWLHICKNICCNTEHLSRLTCEFFTFRTKIFNSQNFYWSDGYILSFYFWRLSSIITRLL